jgi:hypothetical protein
MLHHRETKDTPRPPDWRETVREVLARCIKEAIVGVEAFAARRPDKLGTLF